MYADIIVDISHDKLDKTFQYQVPAALAERLVVGMQVNVPFGRGNRLITGYIVNLTDTAEFDTARMKEIHSVAEGKVPIGSRMIRLA